jgi:hypothetical protein
VRPDRRRADVPLPGDHRPDGPGPHAGRTCCFCWKERRQLACCSTGDAAKNRAELLSHEPEATDDRSRARESIDRIWSIWREVPGTILVPGHDLSLRLTTDGKPEYIGERKAGITAWFDESVELSTTIDLCRSPS